MHPSTPVFSIITPLFNKESYFTDTAKSVLDQSFKDYEWIIINDGSTDRSPTIAREIAKPHKHITLITQKNSGPCTARNHGISKALGDWVLFLDADDTLAPDYLDTLKTILEINPRTEIHAGGWTEVDPETHQAVAQHRPPVAHPGEATESLRNCAIAFAPWHPTSAVVHRKCLRAPCLWEDKMNRMVTEDTVFWWRLIARYRACVHEFNGVNYRRGTPGSRDAFDDVDQWAEGLFFALRDNVATWNELGHKLNGEQVANLVRVLEKFGLQAERQGKEPIAAEAFGLASLWLETGAWRSPPGRLRQWLGPRRFQQIRHLLPFGN